jgi:hypothetical protein
MYMDPNILAGTTLKRVKAIKGSAGVNGMTVQQLPEYLKQHWPAGTVVARNL